MTKPDYIYVLVIASPPEKVWEGLTSAEFTKRYWHKTEVKSDFKVGSAIQFMTESGQIGCEGEILSVNYPFELSFTWQFPNNPDTRDEQPSRVSFSLEPIAAGTKLTVVHDQFPAESKMFDLIQGGWPLVLCGLKTLLESGTAVDFSADHQSRPETEKKKPA